jgi:uncharacterized sulfatase
MNKLLAFTGIALLSGGCIKTEEQKPNILFILLDDLGYGHVGFHNDTLGFQDLDPDFIRTMLNQQDDSDKRVNHHPNNNIEVYSPDSAIALSKRAMPTLNALAENSVIFTNAYACNSLCSPSRVGIATGLYPGRLGVYENADAEANGMGEATHLAHILQESGYATAHIGKWHIGKRNQEILNEQLRKHNLSASPGRFRLASQYPGAHKDVLMSGYYGSVIDEHHPLQNGFDYYFGYNNWASQFYNSYMVWENYQHAGLQKDYNTDVFTDTAISFMSGSIDKKMPFYVQLHYHAVHDSLKPKAPDKYYNRFNTGSYDLNNFYAHLFAVDANLSKIMQMLQTRKVLKNTIIVFSSDNGASSGGPSVLPGNAPFSGHKGTYFCGGVRVPFLFYWPDKITKKHNSEVMVSNMDILPTLIEASGGAVPGSLDGKSLLKIITRESDEPVHDYLCWAGMHSTYFGFLIERSLKSDLPHAPPAFAVMKDGYLLRYTGKSSPGLYADCLKGCEGETTLFNIHQDPAEKQNLVGHFPEKADELISIYREWQKILVPPVKWNIAKWEEIMDGGCLKIPEN